MPAAPAIEARNLSRRFGEVTALDDVLLTVHPGEFFALLGPSGCGKTTLLRIIAGLDQPDAGELLLDGAPALDVPAHRRPVNTVFQSYALFPHLNVLDNVAFGLRMKGVRADEIRRRVGEAMELVQIGTLARRAPSQLSGGQRQRVALARALVNRPSVLLLDEPLAALDRQLRSQLQAELRALQRRVGITFVLVTHDQEEALAMSDRLAVLRAGRVEQVGTGEEVYARPRNRFVAEFLGACNVLDAVLENSPGPCASVSWGGARIELPSNRLPARATAGSGILLGVRPENVRLLPAGTNSSPDSIPATVRERTYAGSGTQFLLDTPGGPLRADLVNLAGAQLSGAPGESVRVVLPAEALVVLEA